MDWPNLIRRITPRGLRNWLRRPGASWRWWRSALDWRRGARVRLDFGEEQGQRLVLECHPESGRTFSLFLHDADSQAELHEFRALLPAAPALFDLGAHYGFFTLVTLALGGPQARVLAVEPSPVAGAILQANLELSGGGGRARVLRAAAGAGEGSLAMLSGGVASENYMLAAGSGRPDAVAVPQFGLAGLARQAGWAPNLIKLDIEGGESELLESEENRAMLAAWRAPLMLELHCGWVRARGRDPSQVLTGLRAAGYGPPRWRGEETSEARILAMEVARLVLRPG